MVEFKSIAIVGAGAIGTYYGARLALSGANVRFLMRSDFGHVRAHGIRLVGNEGVQVLRSAGAFCSVAEIGPVDLIVIALKATANRELASLLPPLLHSRTVVLTLQNGLGNEEQIASVAGAERTMGGLCFIAATRTAPGEVTCFHPGTVVVGEMTGPAVKRTVGVASLFQQAGVACKAEDSLAQGRWRKLVWNVPFNGLSIVAGGLTTDRILRNPVLAGRVRRLMDEVAGAARTLGYEITESFIRAQIERTPALGPYQPSSLIDFLAGREIELEAIWGEPLRRGQAAGGDMPELARLYTALKDSTISPSPVADK